MLYRKTSEITVLETLARDWHETFSAYGLSGRSGVNVQSVYEALARMMRDGLVRRQGRRVQIDFTHRYSWQFKLLCDSDRLMRLPKAVQERIVSILSVFRDHYHADLLSAMVIGSAATDQMAEGSDIDMLFLVRERKEMNYQEKDLYRHGKLNLVEKTLSEFGEDFLQADVFVLSALRDGIVIDDSGALVTFYQRALPHPGPHAALREREHLVRVRERLVRELGGKDLQGLVDLFRQYLVELTRLDLIERGEIPGTRADIVSKMPADRRKSYKKVTAQNVRKEALRYV